jgi:hypothetical protein
MNKFAPSKPRAAAGLTAGAMVAITMTALVVLPAKLESVDAGAVTIAAANAATKSPLDVTTSRMRIDMPGAANRREYVSHPDQTTNGVQASRAKRDSVSARRRAEI